MFGYHFNFISVLFALVCFLVLTPTATNAWSRGESIPMTISIRINGSWAKSGEDIPPDFTPRFGVNKNVEIPSLDYNSAETDVAIRFDLGRGLNRGTTWFPLKRVPPTPHSHRSYSRLSSDALAVVESQDEKHLTRVTFKFGFQEGVFGRLTSFHAFVSYSDEPRATIALVYEWNEHRTFNPHRGITIVAVISFIAIFILVHRMTLQGLQQYRHKFVVVRDRSD